MGEGWRPTRIEEVLREWGTSTRVAEVMTDCGRAFVKVIDNPEGPHALARELIGTRIAEWLRLAVVDLVVFTDANGLRFPESGWSAERPSLASRAVEGSSWADAADLSQIENADAVAGLVVLDTWLRNHDRYHDDGSGNPRRNERNVFLQDLEGGATRLVALDHTDCMRLGVGTTLSTRVSGIAFVKDETIFGCFPEFLPAVAPDDVARFVARLGEFERADAEAIVAEVPGAWGLSTTVREAVVDFLVDRARFLSKNFVKLFSTFTMPKG